MTPSRRRAIHEAMVRFADGNRMAFREVFEALWPILLHFSARQLPNRADAEDAAQRALIKVFEQIRAVTVQDAAVARTRRHPRSDRSRAPSARLLVCHASA